MAVEDFFCEQRNAQREIHCEIVAQKNLQKHIHTGILTYTHMYVCM